MKKNASSTLAKGGGAEIGVTKRVKGMKIMAIVDRHGLPLSVSTHAANHHEVRLAQLCFEFYMIEAKPENWIGDRAYDSDPPGRGVAPRRHRDDRATPRQSQQAAYARSTRSNPLYAPLARGLDAGHKATGLIIAAGLRTAQRAARSVASEISENCIAPKYRRRCRRRSTGVAERKPAPASSPVGPRRYATLLRADSDHMDA